MMREQESDTIGILLMVVCALMLGGVWMNWVDQRDEFLGRVMDCMGDNSKQEYTRCATAVAQQRKSELNAGW